ncbi:MAG: hypothetical protein VKL59_08025 [Nostocaceae cyanobacterium]|nr:hypothetical protein [Nostocaceae cyanobacterium]
MHVQQAELYPNASLAFSDRLARDNGWSAKYTQRAIATLVRGAQNINTLSKER